MLITPTQKQDHKIVALARASVANVLFGFSQLSEQLRA